MVSIPSYKIVLIALAVTHLSVFGESDTLVLTQSVFRFPETHPNKDFLVKKVIVHPSLRLKKDGVSEQASTIQAQKPNHPTIVDRDVLGRTFKDQKYSAKLAKIRQSHALPVFASRSVSRNKPLSHISSDWKNGQSRALLISNSPLIRDAHDLARLESEERAAVRKRYGNIHPELALQIESLSAIDSFEVNVSLRVPNPGFLDKRITSKDEQVAHAQRWARNKPVFGLDQVALRYGGEKQSLTKLSSRSFVFRTTKATLLAMARDPEIATIEEQKKVKVLAVNRAYPANFIELINSGYNPSGEMINYSGFNVATYEMGLMNSFVNRLDPGEQPAHYHVYDDSINPGDSVHSAGTYHILALGTPSANRYHFANGWYGTYEGIGDSLLEYHIKAISQSFYRHWSSTTTSDSRFVDRMSYIYPYTSVVMPTCNNGHDDVPCNQAYNSLSVGNVQHYDNSNFNVDFWIWHDGNVMKVQDTPNPEKATQTKNPNPVYGSNADREMPYLVAPGWTPDPYRGFSDSTVPWGLGGGGTSLSVPVVAAIVGNLYGGIGYSWQRTEFMRAVLLVTAENVDGGYWDPANSDERDGAGTVSGANAVKFATSQGPYGTEYDPGPGNWNTPKISAIDMDVFIETDFSNITHQYFFQAPDEMPEGQHLRVVLTWNSSPGLNYAENEVSDLDLYVETNSDWAASLSNNGNIEMIDIPAGALSPNGHYTIEVVPSIFRKATDGPEDVSYSVAWTWVKDHAD